MKFRSVTIALVVVALASVSLAAERVAVVLDAKATPRVEYGAAKLVDALKTLDIESSIERGKPAGKYIAISKDASLAAREGFVINNLPDGGITVVGGDDSGEMYGCMELARRTQELGRLPTDLNYADQPVMVLRGPCIGMQKTYILPSRHVYEYPYTPELFPFFYDKTFWTEYLDFLAQNRFNTLYLWNGHPFASLVKLSDYPYAQEVSDEDFQTNVEMYRWIATECDRRGIWLVQMFYSIILSKPFAEHNNLATQLKSPVPIAADYTRKSIAEFVRQYPNVGLMVCLGEALQGSDNQKQWLCDVILPGIKDGMKEAGLSQEPPVVIRTHATDLRLYMADALAVYKNIYTEAKFNGESLTTWEPRGVRQQVHLAMSRLGSTHLINIHILANLEPFRYGAQRFIKLCVQAGRDRLGARGVHLYPLFYWNWPDSPDKVEGAPLKQWERDWIWFEAWGRYSWNPDIDDATDQAYWIERLTEKYGSKEAAQKILEAYNDSGECAPRILRRFGITEGNRQTMSLGMTLDELVDPKRFGAFTELWESQAPPGERIDEYVRREWNHAPHEGETPPQIIDEVLGFSDKAVNEIDSAASYVTKNKAEYDRLRNDMHCIRAMSRNYAAKAQAAMLVVRYGYSKDVSDMEQASALLGESLEHYRELVRLTQNSYVAANSMQTSQRKIPVPGGSGGKRANYHWSQVLPVYEKELADFQTKVAALKSGAVADGLPAKPLPQADIKLIQSGIETYKVQPGAQPFADLPLTIKAVAPELLGLTGIRVAKEQLSGTIEFETTQPVQLLIGYIESRDAQWRKAPNLETNAAAADRGFDTDSVLRNAVVIDSLPAVTVYAVRFDSPGKHKLDLPGEGRFLVLGAVPQSATISRRDVGLKANSSLDAGGN